MFYRYIVKGECNKVKQWGLYLLILVLLASAIPALASKDTLLLIHQADAKVMDPAAQNDVVSQMACNALYDNLIYVDEKGGMYPMLAERWEVSGDVDYIFYLRKGVKFHNGQELKASDVKFSFDRALTPLGAPVKSVMQHVQEAEIIDDYTVVVRLKHPFTPFIAALYNTVGCIVNRKAVEAAGDDYGMNPVGTGPFKFVEWKKGDRYTFELFEDYWGEKPKYKRLVVRSVPEPMSRAMELESGGADIAFPLAQTDMERISANPRLNLVRAMTNGVVYMGFNTAKAPFDNVDVRRAVNLALDTEGIHKAVWRGVGRVPRSPVGPQIKYSRNDQYSAHQQNQEMARQLLEKAGVKNLRCQIWTNERKERVDSATIIQAQLAEVGIEAEIKVLEWGAYLEGLKKKEHDMYILGWAATVDPEFALTINLQTGMPLNFTSFSNPDFDALLDKGRTIPDGPERENIYKAAQDLINDQVPWVYLYIEETLAGIQKNVRGFRLLPSVVHEVREVYFVE